MHLREQNNTKIYIKEWMLISPGNENKEDHLLDYIFNVLTF